MESIDKATSSAHHVVDQVASAANQAAEAIGVKEEQLKNAEQQVVDCCRRYINDNPITSLGIAVAAGFLLNRFLSGR